MARINVDNEFLCDPRLNLLATKIPRHEAYGALVALWEVGQSYWKKSCALIPLEIFEFLPRATELEAAGFVERRGEHVYCKGAAERWGFLLVQAEKGRKGGIRSAEIRKEKLGTAQPQKKKEAVEAAVEQNLEAHRSPPKHSSSSSSSSSNNTETTYVVSGATSAKSAPEKLESVGSEPNPKAFVAAYVDLWRAKYGTKKRPDLSGKQTGQVRLFLKSAPLQDSLDLLSAYLQMDDKYFQAKCHDLMTFFSNINRITVALDRGRADPHRKGWREIVQEQEAKTKTLDSG